MGLVHLQCLLRHIIRADVEGSATFCLGIDETPLRVGEIESVGDVGDVDGLSIEVLLTEPAPLLHFFLLVMFMRQSVGSLQESVRGSCPRFALAVQSYLTLAVAETTSRKDRRMLLYRTGGCTGLGRENIYIFISDIEYDIA